MSKANYVIFHPEYARQKVSVNATVMENGNIHKNWNGNIFVDSIRKGNEDPFVFNTPWLYSYCHATQLKRNINNNSHLQSDSILIFVSGVCADKDILTIDTVFQIEAIQKWERKPELDLPRKYQDISKQSDLWVRHFRFPFEGYHTSVTYTYEAKLWKDGISKFSFLPLSKNGNRVSIPFESLPAQIADQLRDKRKGKYPAFFDDEEITCIVELIEAESTVKVLRDIICKEEISINKGSCNRSC